MSKERELLEKVLKESGDEKNRHHISVDLYLEILNLLDQPEPFPQPRKNTGGNPCGECHLQAGETCCICGAINKNKGP